MNLEFNHLLPETGSGLLERGPELHVMRAGIRLHVLDPGGSLLTTSGTATTRTTGGDGATATATTSTTTTTTARHGILGQLFYSKRYHLNTVPYHLRPDQILFVSFSVSQFPYFFFVGV